MSTDASYCLLRFTADPVRNEPINIGIIAWTQGTWRLTLDSDALGRVLTFNPELDRELFVEFDTYLKKTLASSWPEHSESVPRYLSERLRFPIQLSAPRYLALRGGQLLANALEPLLEREVDALMRRLVRPRKRQTASTSAARPTLEIRKRLAPYLDSKIVTTDYEVTGGRTNEPRILQFYANSGTNVGMEIIQMANVTSPDTAKRHADALAYTIEDIQDSVEVNGVVVYLPADQKDVLRPWIPIVGSRMKALGIDWTTEAEDAVSMFRTKARLDQRIDFSAD